MYIFIPFLPEGKMDRKNYIPRIIDSKVDEYLKTFGAVCMDFILSLQQ